MTVSGIDDAREAIAALPHEPRCISAFAPQACDCAKRDALKGLARAAVNVRHFIDAEVQTQTEPLHEEIEQLRKRIKGGREQ